MRTEPLTDLGPAAPVPLPRDEGASKVMSLAGAVRTFVRPGDAIHVAYSDARPNAALMEVVRQFVDRDPHFTLITAGLVSAQHSLVELGLVERVVASFAGENYPVARPNPAFRRALADGRTTIENWSLWSLVARLVAGALGVPFFPVRSLLGSSMADEHRGRSFVELEDVFGESVGAVSALRPDVVLLQGVVADAHGNVLMSAPYGESHWGALAARRGVIACVEQVVDTETIRRFNTLVRIPSHVVLAVCEVPFGSHPYGLYSGGYRDVPPYVEDGAFMAEVFEACHTEVGFRRWIEEWILAPGDHLGYLRKLGSARLDRLTGSASPLPWRDEMVDVSSADVLSRSEAQVVAASRRIAERVREGGHAAVLAGVGLANLAAWHAAGALRRGGVDVELMAEIGMMGYTPRPGEPFIFASRNLPTCKLMTDVMGVLGTYVSGPATRSLGVVGAAQIDAQGSINSTYDDQGRFLVGSGGANDIASASQEVLVTVAHDRRRLVPSVAYTTCPGRNVRSVVTSRGVFALADGRYTLLRHLGGTDVREAVAEMRAESGWDFDVASDVAAEPPPTADDLALLRTFDPTSVFLGARSSGSGGRPPGPGGSGS